MRFLFYDRIIHIRKGSSILGTKTFSLSDEFLRGHFGSNPLIPGSLYIEAMAQLLGWLIVYSHDFRIIPILSVIEGVSLDPKVRTGIKAEIRASLLSTSHTDSLGKAFMLLDHEPIASVNRVLYTHVTDVQPGELRKRFHYYSGLASDALAVGNISATV